MAHSNWYAPESLCRLLRLIRKLGSVAWMVLHNGCPWHVDSSRPVHRRHERSLFRFRISLLVLHANLRRISHSFDSLQQRRIYRTRRTTWISRITWLCTSCHRKRQVGLQQHSIRNQDLHLVGPQTFFVSLLLCVSPSLHERSKTRAGLLRPGPCLI